MNKKNYQNFVLSLVLSILILSCVTEEKRIIMTVDGPIPAQRMDLTLAHEHILVDFIGADSTGSHRWNRDEVVEKVLPFLKEAKSLGVNTLIECTPAYLGRDPILLKMLSQRSGLQILTNTGYYGAQHHKFVPQQAFEITTDQLAEIWIKEWEEGIEETKVKPGFIKIAVDRDDTLSTMHEKIARAAARTHLKTGLPIMSHTGPEKPAFEQLAILEAEGVSASAFIWTHAQRGTKAAHVEAAKRGAWISIDNVKDDTARINQTVEFILNMKENGLLDRVLISHDAGWYQVGEPDGGNFRGYTAIFKQLIPALKKRGFTQQEIDQLLVINPRKVFSIKANLLK